MSGGTAYVLDLREVRVNRDMVDLDALDAEDVALLHDFVSRHAGETDSPVARELLADWAGSAGRFTKVMPRDFKNVLAARARALEEGLAADSPQVWDAILEASRG
jgi:glutamate synthase (NADPH/NADH) large chain